MRIEKVDRGWKVVDSDGNITYFGEYGHLHCNDGTIYKDYNAFKNKKGVCYIPEYGFENSEQNGGELFEFKDKKNVSSELVDNPYWSETGYTYEDFLSLCNGNEDLAYDLFESVDWQSPETLLDEWLEDEETRENYGLTA